MLGNRKLVVDNFAGIEKLLAPYTDEFFYEFSNHTIVPGAIYVIGREQFKVHATYIRELVESNTIYAVYSNPCEGSEPMHWNFTTTGVLDLVESGRIGVVTGGDLPKHWKYLLYENFLPQLNDYKENLLAAKQYAEQATFDRPYKFLFLNGRMRDHRKYLLLRLQELGLLDSALWTNLDSSLGVGVPLNEYGNLLRFHNNTLLLREIFPAHYLPAEYEVDRYRNNTTLPETITHRLEAKSHLFSNEWGEIYLTAEPYLATAFSLVSETVFSYPHSFRTEKLWKPICIGHPFIVASNPGYYRDLHNLGFHTFGHLIDESWDSITDAEQRIERIVATVEDLCRQDLSSFLRAAKDTCKYNQLLLAEQRQQIRSNFPNQFLEYINERFKF
jgi:hypothetical protein